MENIWLQNTIEWDSKVEVSLEQVTAKEQEIRTELQRIHDREISDRMKESMSLAEIETGLFNSMIGNTTTILSSTLNFEEPSVQEEEQYRNIWHYLGSLVYAGWPTKLCQIWDLIVNRYWIDIDSATDTDIMNFTMAAMDTLDKEKFNSVVIYEEYIKEHLLKIDQELEKKGYKLVDPTVNLL